MDSRSTNNIAAGDALRYGRWVAALIVALVVVRLVCAALVPLAFDEAYYWLWSKHIAGGYLDHPPMVAVVIRLGTLIAGDTEFGVRLVPVLLGLPATWAGIKTERKPSAAQRSSSATALGTSIGATAQVGAIRSQ